MTSFKNSSYLSQVHRLRKLAQNALEYFPIKNYDLKFIQHGENATFKISTNKQDYLLRLHRDGYHSKPALLEELKWLRSLSVNTDIPVQKPLPMKNGSFIILAKTEGTPPRYCSVLEWQPGRIQRKSPTPLGLSKIGHLTAQLHKSAKNTKIRYRDYWTANNLLAPTAKLGPLQNLKQALPSKDFLDLMSCRKMAYTKMRAYEKRYPHRMSLIHADLHFGNMLWNKGVIYPIDFDDCGLGIQMYDLAVTLFASQNIFKLSGPKKTRTLTNSLLEGYCKVGSLSDQDIEIIPYLILARKVSIFAWLYDRSDNPRLLKYFNKNKVEKLKEFKKILKNGPSPIL